MTTLARSAVLRATVGAAVALAAALLPAQSVPGPGAGAMQPPGQSPGAGSRLDAIKARGVLRVAVLDEYPWLKQNRSGVGPPFMGAAWLLATEYARRLGVRLEAVPVAFDNKVSILERGQVDISIAPLLATPARAKAVDLILYSVSAQCLVGRADNPKVARAARMSDLNQRDVTIAYITGSPQGAWLQQRLPRAARRGVPGNLADVPVDEVLSRRADVTTIDKYFFAGLADTTPGLTTVPRGAACLASRELPIPIGMAVGKHQPAFLAWLRGVAREIKPRADAEHARVTRLGR